MSLAKKDQKINITPTQNINDVSFSIPEWKNQQIQSLHQGYEKQIYISVPLSLTDFDSREQIQFLSKPKKSKNQAYAYERQLLNKEDFGIFSFLICMEQTFIGQENSKSVSIDFLKKRINDLNLCGFADIPLKFKKHYDNKILKKILFQYINKGSYNVSLLQILLRKNHVLKFALSLVSKSLLKRSGLIEGYSQQVDNYIEMKICGEYFRILTMIKVRQRSIDSQNFYVTMRQDIITIYRKQNIIKNSKNIQKRPRSSSLKKIKESRTSQKKSSKETNKSKQKGEKEGIKRSNSLINILKKLICY